jgi:hypothetical protein
MDVKLGLSRSGGYILRVIESRLLMNIFGTEWNEAKGELRNWTAWISSLHIIHVIK